MKLKQLFVPLLAVFALSACSDDAPTSQAEKYTTLETPVKVADLAPVTEVFSLSCGHCRSMESAIPAIEEAASVKIGKAHVTFNESATFAALIYYAASTQEDGNPPKDLVAALFEYVQEQQTDSAEDNKRLLGDVFAKFGLTSPYELDEAQQAKLFTAIEQADALTVQSGINSVPTFLVKGKYVVNTSAHESAEELGATLKMLLNKAD